MGAAVFFQCDSRPLFDTFCLENLSVFSIHQKMEQNPTYNWADLIHFRDETGIARTGPSTKIGSENRGERRRSAVWRAWQAAGGADEASITRGGPASPWLAPGCVRCAAAPPAPAPPLRFRISLLAARGARGGAQPGSVGADARTDARGCQRK